MMAEMGWREVPLKIIGDSKASETWCAKERFRSTVSRGAAMIYMSLGVEFDFWIEETEFVLSEDNEICDALSRRSEADVGKGTKTATDLVRDLGMDPRLLWEVETSPHGIEMIELCNPLLTLNSDATFIQFSERVKRLVSGVKQILIQSDARPMRIRGKN